MDNVSVDFYDVENPVLETRITNLLNYVAAHFGVTNITVDFEVDEDFGYDAEAGIADYEEDKWNPSSFLINVDRKLLEGDVEHFLTTVAHEMIHVCQYANCDVVIDGKDYYWKGELFRCEKTNGPITIAEYYSFPWEQEAYGMERAMYYGFVEQEQVMQKLLAMMG